MLTEADTERAIRWRESVQFLSAWANPSPEFIDREFDLAAQKLGVRPTMQEGFHVTPVEYETFRRGFKLIHASTSNEAMEARQSLDPDLFHVNAITHARAHTHTHMCICRCIRARV